MKYPHMCLQYNLSEILGTKAAMTPLALPYIAALTPDKYDMEIVIEDYEKINFNKKPDILAITTSTTMVERGFEIAKEYKKRLGEKVTIIMGGPYASYETEHCLEYADVVMKGEADLQWANWLKDWENGSPKKIYETDELCDYQDPPFPRWDLIKDAKNLLSYTVMASRGCPFECEFCLVHKMNGGTVRQRSVDNVINEISKLPGKELFFADDNLTINKKWAKELMRKLKPLNISFMCQCSVHVGEDEELLQLMSEAGCHSVMIGMESLNKESLKETKKFHNKTENYPEIFRKIQDHGMHPFISHIGGFEHDTLDVFDDFVDFSIENRLLYIIPNILTMTPGTDLTKRIRKTGRIMVPELTWFNGMFPSLKYDDGSKKHEDMLNRFYLALRRNFSYKNVLKKAQSLYSNGKFNKIVPDSTPFFSKMSIFFQIYFKALFGRDKDFKKLFFTLFNMARRNEVSQYEVFRLLMSMMSYNQFLDDMNKSMPYYLSQIKDCRDNNYSVY